MHTLMTYFKELLKNIEPPPHRLEAAQEIPERVRTFLKESDDFPTLPPHSALAGSYRRHTTVGDIKDVDIIIKVDAGLDENPGSVIRSLKKELDKLPQALGLQGYAEVRESRRSVHVYFENKDFHLDVVPAIVPDEIDQVLYVPDKSWGQWIKSNPIGYARYLSKLNEQYGEKVVPLIKLVKYFRDFQMKTRKPKSYWLESLVLYHLANDSLDMQKSLPEVFRDLMRAIRTQFAPILGRDDGATPHIPDPMLGQDISWNWERSHFETFMRRIQEAEDLASKALQTDDRDEAVNLWQQVFGDEKFPKEARQAAAALSKAVPGVAYISGAGYVTAQKPTIGKYVPSQPTKFYGEE